MRIPQAVFIVAALFAAGCSSPTSPTLPSGTIQINGLVRYVTLEGGFWAVRGDDGVTYDPMNGLSPEYQRENLPVTLVAKVRNDLGGTHMVGPIVEVLSIRTR